MRDLSYLFGAEGEMKKGEKDSYCWNSYDGHDIGIHAHQESGGKASFECASTEQCSSLMKCCTSLERSALDPCSDGDNRS